MADWRSTKITTVARLTRQTRSDARILGRGNITQGLTAAVAFAKAVLSYQGAKDSKLVSGIAHECFKKEKSK